MDEGQKISMREIHRYLGFFLAGIMAIYALSGITLIFRNTDTFKKKISINSTIATGLDETQLGRELKIKRLKIDRQENDIKYFRDGEYNSLTGEVNYVKKETPFILDKLQHMHKATTDDPLFYLNIFFGLSLLFFVISAFWMFLPSSKIFKKGLIFVGAGMLLVIIMLFV